jgi:hypothetical protein
MLMLNVVYVWCRHYVHYAECRYSECHQAECLGTVQKESQLKIKKRGKKLLVEMQRWSKLLKQSRSFRGMQGSQD